MPAVRYSLVGEGRCGYPRLEGSRDRVSHSIESVRWRQRRCQPLQSHWATKFWLATNQKGASRAFLRRKFLWETIWRRRISRAANMDKASKVVNRWSTDRANA